MENQKNENIEIDIQALLRNCLKHWYWFAISCCICATIGVLYFLSKTPVYNVSSTVLLRLDDQSQMFQMTGLDFTSILGSGRSRRVVNELQILKSRSTIQQSIRELDIQTEYRKKQGLRWVGQYPKTDLKVVYPLSFEDTLRSQVLIKVVAKSSGYKVKVKYGKHWIAKQKISSLDEIISTPLGDISFLKLRELEEGDEFHIITPSMQLLVDNYRQQIMIDQLEKTSDVLEISISTDMPSREIRLLSKMTDIYMNDAVIEKQIIADNTKKFIDERLNLITQELDDVETDVELYKKQHGITSLSDEAVLYLQGSAEYKKQRVAIEIQQNLLDFLRDFVNNEENNNSFIPANIGVDDKALQQVVTEYNELLLQRVKLERSATSDNPMLSQLNQQLQVMRSNIISSISTAENGLKIQRENLMQQERVFAGKIEDVPTQERNYLHIMRLQETKQNVYLFLCQKREENGLSLASIVPSAKVIDKPQRDTQPLSMGLVKILIIALIFGLILPIGVLLLWDLLDSKIRTQKQYEKLVNVPVLGQLVRSKSNSALVVSRKETSISAELFRSLRTNLRFLLPSDQQSHVILITSSVNGEGKSFVSINLALSMALLGKKVALVGLDIRKPTLANYLGLSSKGALTSYLADSSFTVDDIIIPSGLEDNFDVLPAGVVPPNPNELLQSNQLEILFEELRKRYDYIFVDSAPVAMVSDTFLLNRISDMTLYVSRADYTDVEMTDFINKINEEGRLKNIACVLNSVKAANAGYGYGYGYGYGNKNGGGGEIS